MKKLVPAAVLAVIATAAAYDLKWGFFFLPFLAASCYRYRLTAKSIVSFTAILLLFFLLASARFSMNVTLLEEGETSLNLKPDLLIVEGDLVKGEAVTAGGERIRLQIRLKEESEQQLFLQAGDLYRTCRWKGELTPPSPSKNPHAFNYETYLHTQRIHWILSVKELPDPSSCSGSPSYFLTKRLQLMNHLETTFPELLQPLGRALLFGDRSMMEEDLLATYQSLGIVHLLAISGMHVGIITAILWYLLRRIGVTKESTGWLLLVLLPLYAYFAGGSPPVIRAVSIVICLVIMKKLKLRITLIQALSLILIIQLLVEPYQLLQIGFQLSYAVSGSILLSVRFLSGYSKRMQAFLLTFVSQAGALPILLWHFHELSIASFLTNLLYIPLFTIVLLPMYLLFFSLSFFPVIQKLLPFLLMEQLVLGIDRLSGLLDSTGFSTVVTGKPTVWLLFLYFLLSVFFLLAFETKRPRLTIPLCLLLLADFGTNQFHPHGEILMIDVGQGDAILIDLPWGDGTYLIDTGGLIPYEKESWQERDGEFAIGKDILWPLFKSKGITSIDALILTHGDQDHIGAAAELTEWLEIDQVWITPSSTEKPLMEEVEQHFAGLGVPVYEKKAPFEWGAGDAAFSLLYPSDDVYEGNNDSLVVYGHAGGLSWLFTGDLETEGEESILNVYNVEVDVLKIGHHGSAGSTGEAFIDGLKPSVALLSVGAKNRYGHPHPDVTERLERHGVTIYRTDHHGAVSYRYFGETGNFSTQLPYTK